MQVRVVTMRYQEGLQGFSEEVLQKVTFGRTVLDVTEHYFVYGNVPHLSLILKLADAPQYENAGSYRPRDPNMPTPDADLTDAQKAVYRALKEWRNETSKAEGRPAYAIARNIQLAAMVKAAPKSKAALKEIEGVGEGFCEKYGERVLQLLSEQPAVVVAEQPAVIEAQGESAIVARGASDAPVGVPVVVTEELF